MKRFLLAALIALAPSGHALAHDYKLGDLLIHHPWSRATPAGASVGGGYVDITNTGSAPDRLVAVVSDASTRVEMHEMAVKDGVMSMRGLPEGVVIAPGAKVDFKPGGYHIMFVGLKAGFKEGERVKARLQFEKAGTVDVEFVVNPLGQTPQEHVHPTTTN